jgi:hypothetical protein
MFKTDPSRGDAASQVKRWTRSRFGLSAGDTIFVSELEGGAPGFPPLRTVVAFWMGAGRHYHFSVFKPLGEVTEDDIPPAWYRDALAVTPGMDCGCC